MIFLVGMPATGKTYWGEKLAFAHSRHFVDLDDYIREQEKMTIPAIFEQLGEDGFRKVEHESLQRVITTSPANTVVACGGGTPCFMGNMDMMKNAGTVIYLKSDVSFLLGNLETETKNRPLLTGRQELNTYLQELLEKRKGFYEQANYILQTGDISLHTFDPIIQEHV